jgi:hypothetical protein
MGECEGLRGRLQGIPDGGGIKSLPGRGRSRNEKNTED